MNTTSRILAAGICAATTIATTAMATVPLDIQTRQEEFGVAEAAQAQGDQAQIDLEVIEKMKEAVVALGASAARTAISADSSVEADHVLAAFCRAMERCIEAGLRPLDPHGGSLEPVLRAVDIAEIADRQRAIWNATPEQKERWDGGVSDAAGQFHGVVFRLREGGTTVRAPCGLFNESMRDYTKDSDGNDAPWRQWRLETLPQWTFRLKGKDCFLLMAQGLDDNGHSRYGDAAREDALLLMWREKDAAADGDCWNCSYLASRLYPLETEDAVTLEEFRDPDLSGTLLKIDTFWRSEAAGERPVVFALVIGDNGRGIRTGIWEQTASRLFDCWPIRMIWYADALHGSQFSNSWTKVENIQCKVSLRNPLPDNALDAFLENGLYEGVKRGRAVSSDEFNPFGEHDGEEAVEISDKNIIRDLLQLYGERTGFEREFDEAIVDKWRMAKEPQLLSVSMTNTDADGSGLAENIDFSISLDGAYLLFENGYCMPCASMPDGSTHERIADGGGLFAIPEERREEVRALINKAANLRTAPTTPNND